MDLIITNGVIYTMDISKPLAQAVAVNKGRFVKVGTNEDVLPLRTDETKIIDLKGRALVPGFNDSHMHLLSFGYSHTMADLNGAASVNEMIIRVKEFIDRNGIEQGRWVIGRGWNHDYFTGEKRFPTRHDLDKISKDHPIVLTRVCGHVCVVNSRALKEIGISKNSPQVAGGCFDVDEDEEPSGIFRENALSLVYDKIPGPSMDEAKEMIKQASVYANSRGLTSVQSDDFDKIPGYGFREVIKIFNELAENGELTLRVYEQCLLPKMDILNDFIGSGYRAGRGNELFKIGPLKLLADGSLGARTAALTEPYADDPSTSGMIVYNQDELDDIVCTAHKNGMHTAIHCIGDRAMYMAFDAIEKALDECPREDHRHSIVHCQITDAALLNRFKKLCVFAHIQPIFLHYDMHIVEDRIGEDKAKKTYAFSSMIKAGVRIGLGTDCPVEALDVMPNIYCAVTRKDLNGYPDGGWLPEERISVEDAVYSYTMGGAYASFEENIKGSISEGKLADMVVLAEDIFKAGHDLIKNIQVDMTFLGGNEVYNR